MSNDPQVEHTPHSPEKVPVPAKKDADRSALAIELSKVIIPVVGTILAACLSGIFLLLNNSSLLRTAAVEVTPTVLAIGPTVLVITATPPPALTATSLPTAASTNLLPTPTRLAPADWKLVLRDDFSDPNSGWGEEETEARKYEYIDGGYQITVNIDGKSLIAFPTMNRVLKDVRVQVDSIKMAGDEPYEIGMLCRMENNLDFYSLEYYYAKKIGKFGIFKWNANSYQTLGEVVINDPTWINPDKQANRLRIECVGPSLALYINDKKAIEVIDASLKTGNVGLLAGYSKGVKVFFDNFVVYEP